MEKKRLFVCYASQEKADFDQFIKESVREKIAYELVYTEDKDALSDVWKSETSEKIGSCNGVVVLVSPKTKISEDAFWEMKCSKDLKKPIIAVFVGEAGIRDKPMDLTGVFTMVMAWDRLADFVNKLE